MLIDAAVFVPFLIIAITQVIKMFVPKVSGAITILVALAIGILVALLDTHIGVRDITVAQGLLFAGEAVGITVAFSKAGGGSAGDGTPQVQ